MMAYPTPIWNASKAAWDLDLRSPWGFGRYVLRLPLGDLVGAVHQARDLLDGLRSRAELSSPQLRLPDVGGLTFRVVTERYQKTRETSAAMYYASDGGKRWVLETCRALILYFGHMPIVAFVPPAGTRLLLDYRDWLRGTTDAAGNRLSRAPWLGRRDAEGYRAVSAKTARDRLGQLRAILIWASEVPRQWLPALPTFPPAKIRPAERMHNPRTEWIDHGTFRAMRAALYDDPQARRSLSAQERLAGRPDDAAAVRDLVERRRLYLSFAFYTGMRKHDLDDLCDASVAADLGAYVRRSSKNRARPLPEAMPAPLLADLAAERRRLRRHYRAGERIAGGPWKNADRVMRAAAARAGVAGFNLRDCRRSFIRYKALAGVSERDLVDLMGHVDSAMIRAVYLRTLPAQIRNPAGAAWYDDRLPGAGTGAARVLPFKLPVNCQNRPKGAS